MGNGLPANPVSEKALTCKLFYDKVYTSMPPGKSAEQGESKMLDSRLLEILACPKCKGDLEYDQKNAKLICHACRLKYDIKDDIPIMLIDQAEKF
jgi:hypothetical protein